MSISSATDGRVIWQKTASEHVPHESHYLDTSWACASPITDGERLYVFSAGEAGKVKRLRNSARARVTPCDFRGRLHGEPRDATARILDEAQGIERAYAALHAKYGWQMRLSDWLSRITGRLQQRAILEIVLA